MKISEGTIMKKPPAKRYGNCDSSSTVNTKAGKVRLRTVRITAAKTSFQESTKVKSVAAANPGKASGNEIRRKAWN